MIWSGLMAPKHVITSNKLIAQTKVIAVEEMALY